MESAGQRTLQPTCSTFELFYFTIEIMPRLPFITFEGSEGCGKSTQVQRLAARLKNLQIPFLVTREPGGTPIGETIRELLQFAPHNSAITPETELLLFEASRSQLVRGAKLGSRDARPPECVCGRRLPPGHYFRTGCGCRDSGITNAKAAQSGSNGTTAC